MTGRQVAVALLLVVVAVVLQGSLFGEGRIHPFGASPNIVVLVVVATVRYLEPEPAMLVGFTGGLLTDLLGGSPLGLWAMALTVVAYVTLRVRDRADDGPVVIGFGLFILTLLGHGLFALTGTLFGQQTLANSDVTHLMLLPALYTTILGAAVLPLVTLAMRAANERVGNVSLAWRTGVLGIVFFALLGLLSLRMWQIQVAEGQVYAERAESNQVGFAPTPAPRGEIRDSNGVLLAGTRPALAAVVDAKILSEEDEPQLVAQLSALFGLSVDEVQEFIDDVQFRGDRVPIANELTQAQALFITEHGENFPGVEVEPQPIRTYPLGEVASDVIGFIGLPQPADVEAGAEPTVLLGRAGLEREYDSQLQGTSGQIVYRFDARRQGDVLSQTVPTPGNTLHLTIDVDLQAVVERSLAEGLQLARDLYNPECIPGLAEDGGDPRCPVRAVGVVMDATNGAVLAMASVPTYDPNIFIGGVSQAELDALPDGVFNNFAIQGEFAPASTFKAVTYFTAYEEGKPPYSATSLEEEILCSGELRLPFIGEGSRQVYNNWTGRDDGRQNIHRAFTRSCNVYFWEIAYQIWSTNQGTEDESILQDWARDFGFGEPSGIDLPFERRGLVPDRALFELWKEESPQRLDPARLDFASPWLGGDLLNAAVGQGEVTVTPLQLANAYATMVNGGNLWEPYVVDHIENLDGDVVADQEPELIRTIPITVSTVASFRRDLQTVVNDPSGTAYSAFSGFGDNVLFVGGKTGTAEIIKDTEEQAGVSTALFAGVAPVNDPKYVVVVVIERGGSGGRIAAPTARPILQFLLNGPNAVTPIDAGEDAD